MPIAEKVVNRALSLIGVKNAEQSITPTEMSDGIEVLNDMMSELAGRGVNLRYQKAVASTDELGVPDWAVAMMKSNLAERLAPEYDRTVTPALAKFASKSMDNVSARALGKITVVYPDILPIGENAWSYDLSKYFQDESLDDLETGLGVVLETGEAEKIKTEE